MGLLGIVAKKAALGAVPVAIAMAEEHNKQSMVLPHRLEVKDASKKSSVIKLMAEDERGQLMYTASGGGFLSDKASASLYDADGKRVGSVYANSGLWYSIKLEGEEEIEVQRAAGEGLLQDIVSFDSVVKPYGWSLRWARPGVFKSRWEVENDGKLLMGLGSSPGYHFIEAVDEGLLKLGFALSVCLFDLERES